MGLNAGWSKIRMSVTSVAVTKWMSLAMLVSSATMVVAQDTKPADKSAPAAMATDEPTVLIGINSLDNLMPDLAYLTRASGQPQMVGAMLQMYVNQYSQGIDRKRPIGFSVNLKAESQPQMFLMLPISNFADFLSGTSQVMSHSELGDDKYEFELGLQRVYGVFKNQWLFVTQFEEDLSSVPADPQPMISRLSDRYDVALSLQVQSIPEETREQFLENLDRGFESAFQKSADSMSEEELEIARQRGQESIQQLKDAINETSQVLVGLNIDQQAKVVLLDIGTKFVVGSSMAKQTQLQKDAKTAFAAYAQASDPIQIKYRSIISPEEIKRFQNSIDMQREQLNKQINDVSSDPAVRKILEKIGTTVIDSLSQTIKDGQIDGCYAINFEGGLNLVSGGTIADSSKLQSDILDLFKDLNGTADAPTLNPNPKSYANYQLFNGSWKVPADKSLDGLRQAVGENLRFVVGFGPKAAVLALGSNCEVNIKAAIDRAASQGLSPANPGDLQIEVTPVLQYAQSLVKDPKVVSILNAAIEKALAFSSNDMIRVNSRVVDNGFIARTTIEEGVLQAAGAAATASAPQARR